MGLKVFQVLKSNSFADPSTNWVQKTAFPPKPTFPWPFFPHTSHTLPLTWHHTKLFCGWGSKFFRFWNQIPLLTQAQTECKKQHFLPNQRFPWPLFPHTSHTLPLTRHHTKLFWGWAQSFSRFWILISLLTQAQTEGKKTALPPKPMSPWLLFPIIPHIAPNMAPYEASLEVWLKKFQVLKSNSCPDGSTSWM